MLRPLPTRFPSLRGSHRWPLVCVIAIFLLLGHIGLSSAQDSVTAPELQHYLEVVKPILKAKCYACHGALKAEAGLRLDTAEFTHTGGDSGNPTESSSDSLPLLLRRIDSDAEGPRMPIEGAPLDEAQREALAQWLASGALGPAEESPETPPEAHWAFQPPRAHPTPTAAELLPDPEPRNAVDGFIQARLALAGLSPAPLASPEIQLRRLWLDLVGVPPTPDDLSEFLADQRPDAYERVVDRLLASPRHGERWARHWMDIWRYADWHGRRMVPDVWNSAPQIWRWRDWIVNAANRDMGYDQMVQSMLAADELHGDDPEQVVATGYLVRNWYALNPNDWMRSNVEHTARAFLGLSLQCAHCHDHKYDPITQHDYFAFRAFFEPLGLRQDQLAGEEDPGPFQEYEYSTLRRVERRGTVSVYDRSPEAPTWKYAGGDERNRDTDAGPIAPAFPAFLSDQNIAIESIELPLGAWLPAARADLREQFRSQARREIQRFQNELAEVGQNIDSLAEQLQSKRDQAREQHAAALTAMQDSPSVALSGQRSVRIDASEGRRILHRSLDDLQLESGMTLSLTVRLERESHFNLQLARDAIQGATAAYIGFVAGQLMAYRPGTTEEFEVARYQPHTEGSLFQLTLRFLPSEDVAELSVLDLRSQQPCATDVRIALNGWNPQDAPEKALALDTRPGTIALIDDLVIRHPATDADPSGLIVWNCDFESDPWIVGGEVLGHDGWFGSSFDALPATARIVGPLPTPEVLATAAQLEAVEGEWNQLQARRDLLALGLKVAQAQAATLDQRLEALIAQAQSTATTEPASSSVSAEQQALAQEEARLALLTARNKIDLAFRELDAAARYTALIQATRERIDAQIRLRSAASPSTLPNIRSYPRHSTGRRRALAQWLTAPDHPLTARVAVNHIWARHFQQPIVATVDDFGRNGAPPSHPELLDRLAVELVERNWSLKELHRRLVTSRLYRTASSVTDSDQWQQHRQLDPDNRLWWRAHTGRMEAEVVRDSLLATANLLDSRMGGQELENDQVLASNRRSLYFSCQPEVDGRSEFTALFDAPEPLQCYRRTRSVMPQQALALFNSALVHRLSEQLADELWLQTQQAPAPQRQFVEMAFQQILARSPRSHEMQACLEYLQTSSTATAGEATDPSASDSALHARQGLIRALWNLNDFVTVR